MKSAAKTFMSKQLRAYMSLPPAPLVTALHYIHLGEWNSLANLFTENYLHTIRPMSETTLKARELIEIYHDLLQFELATSTCIDE